MPQVLVDHFGLLRSGRPASFDMNGLAGACPAVDKRPADYCAQVRPPFPPLASGHSAR
jgi:hypothetical protein